MNPLLKLFKRKISKEFYSLFSEAFLIKKILYNKGLIILMYHSITDTDKDYPYSISKNNFELQMKYLKDNFVFFDIVNAIDYLNGNNIKYENPCVFVTFDDGFKDNISVAYPILKKYEIPFTIFLSTNFIDSSNSTFLNWKEIKEYSNDPLITFGAHSVSHVNFTALGSDDIKKEIINSKRLIENKINKPVDYFAYPFGGYNEKIKLIVESNFKGAFLDRQSHAKFDLFTLPRISIDKNNECLKDFLITLMLSDYSKKLYCTHN